MAHGADINAIDINGNTAIRNAVCSGNMEILKVLLNDEDINVNIADNFGYTPIMFTKNKPEITNVLLRYGANPEIKNIKQQSHLLTYERMSDEDKELMCLKDFSRVSKIIYTILMKDNNELTKDECFIFKHVNEAFKQNNNFYVQRRLLCPIGQMPFHDPVQLTYLDGTRSKSIFEKRHILEWFKIEETDPTTKEPVLKEKLVPREDIKLTIISKLYSDFYAYLATLAPKEKGEVNDAIAQQLEEKAPGTSSAVQAPVVKSHVVVSRSNEE